MAEFLSSDPFGQTVVIPVVRLKQGQYMIGLLKYSLLKDEEDGELIGASSGLTLSDLVKKIHDK